MKNALFTLFPVVFFMIFSGCASVQFYADKNLTEKTGLKYYTVKPYLHVEREPETNRIVKATVLYLPDLANPQYMTIKDGLGSKKLSLKFSDGTINTFGYTSVSKFSESVDALASMVSKSTDAAKDLSSLKSVQTIRSSSPTVELYEIIFKEGKMILRKVKEEKD